MSLDLQARLKVFLASAPQTIHVIEVLEISHSAITTQFLWREPYEGSVTTETGLKTVQPLNFATKLAGTSGHLDQKFDITLDTTDITDLFRQQLDAIAVNTLEKIRLVYRQYLSDDLTAAQATAVLQVESIAYKLGAATLSAVSPRLNVARTGEVYSPKAIPMLRGFV
jgi:hypothetical protein